MSFLLIWSCEHCILWVGVEGDEAFLVLASLYCVDKPEIIEIVDISSIIEDNDDSEKH